MDFLESVAELSRIRIWTFWNQCSDSSNAQEYHAFPLERSTFCCFSFLLLSLKQLACTYCGSLPPASNLLFGYSSSAFPQISIRTSVCVKRKCLSVGQAFFSACFLLFTAALACAFASCLVGVCSAKRHRLADQRGCATASVGNQTVFTALSRSY